MITLCMDTSHVFLVLGIIKDDKVVAKVQLNCWKKQSEELFPELTKMMESVNLQPEDIDAIVITEGPGSYTGVRIAMTVAKVFCAMKEKPIYTIGTLQLYAGCERCRVILDARGERVYTGTFENGKTASGPEVMAIKDLPQDDFPIVGDGHLVGKEDIYGDLVENFLKLKEEWKKAENVHFVKPEYLKSNESYLVKK